MRNENVIRKFLLVCAAMSLLRCTHFEAKPPLNSPPIFSSDAPQKRPDGSIVRPGLTYLYQPVAKDPDAADTVVFKALSLPAHANFDGTLLTWTPGMEQVGVAQAFRLEASDGRGGITVQEWSVKPEARLAPANLVLTPVGSGSPIELHAFRWKVTFQDDDVASTTVQILDPAGATFESGNQTVLWTPPVGSAGPGNLQVRAVNNVGLATETSLPVTIGANRPPVVTRQAGSLQVVEGNAITLSYIVQDPDGDPISGDSIQASIQYQGGPVTPVPFVAWNDAAHRITLTWAAGIGQAYAGHSVTLVVGAADAFGASDFLSESLPVLSNQAPAISALSGNPTSLVSGDYGSFRFSITDPNGDGIDPSTVSAFLTYQGQNLAPVPQVSWDATNARATVAWTCPLSGPYLGKSISLVVRAADAKGASNEVSFPLQIVPNQAPTLSSIMGNPSSLTAGAQGVFRFSVTDSNGDTIDPLSVGASVSLGGQAQLPAPSTQWDAVNGRATITWTPTVGAAYVGKAAVLTLTATDAKGASNSIDVSVQITPASALNGLGGLRCADPQFPYLPVNQAVEGLPYQVSLQGGESGRTYRLSVKDGRGRELAPSLGVHQEACAGELRISWTPEAAHFTGGLSEMRLSFQIQAEGKGVDPGFTWEVAVRRSSAPSLKLAALTEAEVGHPIALHFDRADSDPSPAGLEVWMEGQGPRPEGITRSETIQRGFQLQWVPNPEQGRRPVAFRAVPVAYPFQLDAARRGPAIRGNSLEWVSLPRGSVTASVSSECDGWKPEARWWVLPSDPGSGTSWVPVVGPCANPVAEGIPAGPHWFLLQPHPDLAREWVGVLSEAREPGFENRMDFVRMCSFATQVAPQRDSLPVQCTSTESTHGVVPRESWCEGTFTWDAQVGACGYVLEGWSVDAAEDPHCVARIVLEPLALAQVGQLTGGRWVLRAPMLVQESEMVRWTARALNSDMIGVVGR